MLLFQLSEKNMDYKKYLLVLSAVFAFTLTTAVGQSPVPEPDTLERVKQTDPPATATHPSNENYQNEEQKITTEELPDRIKRTLKATPEYDGWEKGQIEYDRKRKIYTVIIYSGNTSRRYDFNEDGTEVKDQ